MGTIKFVCDSEGKSRIREFQKRMLMTLLAPKKEEATLGLKKFHKGNLHNFPFSRNTIKIIKTIRMRWERFVA
jgi:hypothetical protein